MLHMAGRRSQLSPDKPFTDALKEFGRLDIVEHCRDMTEADILARMRKADVLITMWGAAPIPPALADEPGNVRYVLHLTGTCRPYIPIEIIRSDIPVTNWGDAPANAIAEGAMALLLAVMKDLRSRTDGVRRGEWIGARRLGVPSGTLNQLRLGLYGCGVIGRRFVDMVAPFKPDLLVYDPYADILPDCCRRVDSLEELFKESEALSIFAGLSDQTRQSVTADLLAKLPDHGIVINVARGEIIDQNALFSELKSGRLRAGLDVLDGSDSLPPDHEARQWPNLLLTCHDINSALWPDRPGQMSDADRIALDNLRHFIAGEPLKFEMDEKRYNLST
ncbi:MAG: NAD(P)-dependent oxidoreductase [Lentisphaeria bacterium]|nr:NAD(P)-dependent oxidoreductase [Lentisphaeria bacterium]